MNGDEKKSWLALAATLLSLLTCYGTLAAIALLGALGVGIALNEAVWAGASCFSPRSRWRHWRSDGGGTGGCCRWVWGWLGWR